MIRQRDPVDMRDARAVGGSLVKESGKGAVDAAEMFIRRVQAEAIRLAAEHTWGDVRSTARNRIEALADAIEHGDGGSSE